MMSARQPILFHKNSRQDGKMESPQSLTDDEAELEPQQQQKQEQEPQTRAVIHLDLDCFFVQVEQHLDPSLAIASAEMSGQSAPMAVQQHDDIISVCYAARALGVKKHDKPAYIRNKFPGVRLVHVSSVEGSKVSYKNYRDASFSIGLVLQEELSLCETEWSLALGTLCLEKGSIDEFFVDATLARAPLQGYVTKSSDAESSAAQEQTRSTSFIVGHAPSLPALVPCDKCRNEEQLMFADALGTRLRERLRARLNYVASVGTGPNKMLAKMATSYRKPNGQALICWAHVPEILKAKSLSDIPYFGVRVPQPRRAGFDMLLRQSLAFTRRVTLSNTGPLDWSLVPIDSLQGASKRDLCAVLGVGAGTWVWNAFRGNDDSPVVQMAPPKVISSSMSLHDITEARGGETELETVAGFTLRELVQRLQDDATSYGREAGRLNFSFRILSATSPSEVLSRHFSTSRILKFEVGRSAKARGMSRHAPGFASELIADAMREFRRHIAARSLMQWEVRWVAGSADKFVSLVNKGSPRPKALQPPLSFTKAVPVSTAASLSTEKRQPLVRSSSSSNGSGEVEDILAVATNALSDRALRQSMRPHSANGARRSAESQPAKRQTLDAFFRPQPE